MRRPKNALTKRRLNFLIKKAKMEGKEICLWSYVPHYNLDSDELSLEPCYLSDQAEIDWDTNDLCGVRWKDDPGPRVGLQWIFGPYGYFFENYFFALAVDLKDRMK